MKDRIPTHAGRIKLTAVDATNGIYDMVRADEPVEEGTPLNKVFFDHALAANGVTSGTSTAYTLDDGAEGFTLTDGSRINFRLHAASGDGATIDVNGTGAVPLMASANEAMESGIAAGTWVSAVYSESLGCFIMSGGGGIKKHNNDPAAHGGPFAASKHNHEGADITDLAEHLVSLGYTLETKGSYMGDGSGVATIETSDGGENAEYCVIEDMETALRLSQRVITLPIDASTIEIYANGVLKATYSKGYAKYAYAWHEAVYYNYNNNYRIKIPLVEFTGRELRFVDSIKFILKWRYYDYDTAETTYDSYESAPTKLYGAENGTGTTSATSGLNTAGTTYTYIAY